MPIVQFDSEEEIDSDLIESNGSALGEATYAAANDVRRQFSKFVDRSKKDGKKTLVTEHRKPAAALVPVNQYRILKMLDQAGYTEKLSELTYQDIDGATDFRTLLRELFKDDPTK